MRNNPWIKIPTLIFFFGAMISFVAFRSGVFNGSSQTAVNTVPDSPSVAKPDPQIMHSTKSGKIIEPVQTNQRQEIMPSSKSMIVVPQNNNARNVQYNANASNVQSAPNMPDSVKKQNAQTKVKQEPAKKKASKQKAKPKNNTNINNNNNNVNTTLPSSKSGPVIPIQP